MDSKICVVLLFVLMGCFCLAGVYGVPVPSKYGPPTPLPPLPGPPTPVSPPSPPPPGPNPTPSTPTNVIPPPLVYFFDSGALSWLNPTRYYLLIGGRWDPVTLVWFTADGREIRPNTPTWTVYFGDTSPQFLTVLFPGVNATSWADVFGWMDIDFFNTWTGWQTPAPPPSPAPSPKNVIPTTLVPFFESGEMSWLTPERYTLLVGGRWDPVTLVWLTPDGRQIRPSTLEWTIYFGDLSPSTLSTFFPAGGGSWDDVFGWITPTFFQTWTDWQTIPAMVPQNIQVTISGYIPPSTIDLFKSGAANWLTPDRVRKLAGGQWTGTDYVTKPGEHVTSGTSTWTEYFGRTPAEGVNTLFGGSPGYWDRTFEWLNNAVKNVPDGLFPGGSFPWDTFFKQMRLLTQVTYG